jgi:transposase
VQSAAQLQSQKARLEGRLRRAEEELGRLTLSGKGRKAWRDEHELCAAITAITNQHGVDGLLAVAWGKEEKETKRYGKPGRPSETAVAEVDVEVRYRITAVRRNQEGIEAKEKRLGWRALATNAPPERLTLAGSVLTYREGGGLERPFHQLKDAPLGIRPLFVRLPEQVLGLTRLVLLALRVLTLVEVVLRARLAERGEQLEGLYEGQKTRKEGRPTAKRMLRAVAGLEMTLTVIHVREQRWWYLPPLPTLLVRVLELLGLAPSLYTSLATLGPNPAPLSPASSIPVPSG